MCRVSWMISRARTSRAGSPHAGPEPEIRQFRADRGGRWTAAFAHLLPARPERDLVVELWRHAVVATRLLTFCMLFGGARVRHHPRDWPLLPLGVMDQATGISRFYVLRC